MTDRLHRVTLTFDPTEEPDRPYLAVECPYDGTGPRDCLLLAIADDCEQFRADGTCDLVEARLAGDAEFGHGHATDGCAVREYLDAEPDSVAWTRGFTVTVEATVAWESGYPTLVPGALGGSVDPADDEAAQG